jgi:hypothetical protein
MPNQPFIRSLVFVSCTICLAASGQTPTNQKPAAAPKIAAVKVQRAVWSEPLESVYGISREDFNAIGMSKLTVDETANLLVWVNGREVLAETKGKQEGRATASTYSCGRSFEDEVAHPSVYLFLEFSEHTPAEIQSGLRQKIRSFSDVQIVYDEKDADIVISLLGLEDRTERTNQLTGYTASVATYTSCHWKLGSSEGVFEMHKNHFLETGPSVAQLVEGVSANLDSSDIESIRKEHAMFKKLAESQKK